MKIIRLFLAAAALSVAASASAQFANTNAATDDAAAEAPRKSVLIKDTRCYSRMDFSYAPLKVVTDISGAEDHKLTGLSLGYTHGLNLTRQVPLFLELGFNFTYAFSKQDYEDRGLKEDDGFTLRTNLFSLNVPVSLAYKLSFNKRVSLTPFVGLNFRGNVSASSKWKFNDFEEDFGYRWESEEDFWKYQEENETGMREKTDLCDKKETGNKDATWKRFQAGWQIGVGFNYKHLYIGLSYGKDFNELCKKSKIAATRISLGYNF